MVMDHTNVHKTTTGHQDHEVIWHSAGGSYSGVFVPLLGEAILLGNDAGLQPTINLEVARPGPMHVAHLCHPARLATRCSSAYCRARMHVPIVHPQRADWICLLPASIQLFLADARCPAAVVALMYICGRQACCMISLSSPSHYAPSRSGGGLSVEASGTSVKMPAS